MEGDKKAERQGYQSLQELLNHPEGVQEVGNHIDGLAALQEVKRMWTRNPQLFTPSPDLQLGVKGLSEKAKKAWTKFSLKRNFSEPFMLKTHFKIRIVKVLGNISF
jgi:hypothetical protein